MFKYLIIFLIIIKIYYAYEDIYVKEKFKQCTSTKNAFNCFKYYVINYLKQTALLNLNSNGSSLDSLTFGPVELVYINSDLFNRSNNTEMLGETRQFDNDSEFIKLIKFLKRTFLKILYSYSIKLPLPNDGQSLMIIDEANKEIITDDFDYELKGSQIAPRGLHKKKKKLQILFPLLVMIKLFKVKILLVIMLVGILFIKKAIVATALLLPTVLNHLKICRTPIPPSYGVHYDHGLAADYPGDYGTGGGTLHSAAGFGAGVVTGTTSYGGYNQNAGWSQNPAGLGMNTGAVYDRVYNSYKPK